MRLREISLYVLVIFVGFEPLFAQEKPKHRQPNTTITETLIDYGRTRQRAEEAVLDQANRKAFDGDYQLKNIGLGGRDDEYYCVIQIRHDIYRPENRRSLEEVTVGYGRTMSQAEIDARYKAERMIAERLRSAKERQARQRAMEKEREKRESALDSGKPATILDHDEDNSYILKSIRFSGRPNDYLCYIKFEYLVFK
ncbi:MAG: hypothetical protein AAFX93_03305 [Verrucomicrobiota bacterium]